MTRLAGPPNLDRLALGFATRRADDAVDFAIVLCVRPGVTKDVRVEISSIVFGAYRQPTHHTTHRDAPQRRTWYWR